MNERRSRNLDTVLAAAAAPPLPEEQDERVLADVLTMFNTAGIAAQAGVAATEPITALSPVEPVTGPGGPAPRRASRFPLAVKCTAAFGVFLGASIAIGSAGILPSPVQSFVHSVFGGIGVPGPSPGTAPSGNQSARATPSITPSAGPDSLASASAAGQGGAGGAVTTAPGVSSASPNVAEASLYTLCTKVVGSGNSWKTTMSSQDQTRLVAAAGAENKVHEYCAHLVQSGATATSGSGGSAPTPAPSATKTKGKGKGKSAAARRLSTTSATPSPDPSTSAHTH